LIGRWLNGSARPGGPHERNNSEHTLQFAADSLSSRLEKTPYNESAGIALTEDAGLANAEEKGWETELGKTGFLERGFNTRPSPQGWPVPDWSERVEIEMSMEVLCLVQLGPENRQLQCKWEDHDQCSCRILLSYLEAGNR